MLASMVFWKYNQKAPRVMVVICETPSRLYLRQSAPGARGVPVGGRCDGVCRKGQRRNGIARQLYDVLLPVLKRLGYRSAYAGIALPNEGSIGLHERLGF